MVKYLKSVWLKNVKFTKTVQENFIREQIGGNIPSRLIWLACKRGVEVELEVKPIPNSLFDGSMTYISRMYLGLLEIISYTLMHR